MLFSSPTMMIGASNNSENVDRVNLVMLSFSLHYIPAPSPVEGWNRWRHGQPALTWGHFDQIDSLGNQMVDFEARKKYTSCS
jgi:hypothetical protein